MFLIWKLSSQVWYHKAAAVGACLGELQALEQSALYTEKAYKG